MWAMIPMFRTRSRAVVTSSVAISGLPAVVREGLVGLRHPVDVVLFLVRPALLRHRVEDLRDETRPVERIDLDRTRGDLRATRHYDFLAPYFERAWRRSETPAVSSAARMTL